MSNYLAFTCPDLCFNLTSVYGNFMPFNLKKLFYVSARGVGGGETPQREREEGSVVRTICSLFSVAYLRRAISNGLIWLLS